MKTSFITIFVFSVFLLFYTSCETHPFNTITWVYGEATLTDLVSLDNGSQTYIPVFSWQINPDSIGLREFSNCILSLTKDKEYFISYHFVFYSYQDTILFEWEDYGEYDYDFDGYYFSSNTGNNWVSRAYLREDINTLHMSDIPNIKNWDLSMDWDVSNCTLEEVKIYY